MNNKLSLLYIALILFTSHVSSALVLNDHNLVYFGIQYKPARHHLSNLLIKESKSDVVEVLALKYDAIGSPLDSTKEVSNFTIKYNPHYDNNRLGFSVIFGYYYNKNFRIESEISHEIFQLKMKDIKSWIREIFCTKVCSIVIYARVYTCYFNKQWYFNHFSFN